MPIGSGSIKRASQSAKEVDTVKPELAAESKAAEAKAGETKAAKAATESKATTEAKASTETKADGAKTAAKTAAKPAAKKRTSKAAAAPKTAAAKPVSDSEPAVKAAVLTGANPDIKFYHISDDLPDYLL